MEENPYDVFLRAIRNIYCQFVAEGVPSGEGGG
jgi:hypothetical protein